MTADVRLKWLLDEVDERAGERASELPLLSVSIVGGVRRRSETAGATRAAAEDLSNYKVCKAGELVINRMRAFQGALGVAPTVGLVSPDYSVLRISPSIERRWLSYLLTSDSTVAEMACLVRGIGSTEAGNVRTPRLNVSDLHSMRIPLKPLAEQRAIADFLDRETTRIDTLIEEQQRLIELLRERRQAVIDATITDVAASPVRLRRVIEFLTSGSRGWGDYYSDNGDRFLRIGNLPRTGLDIRGEIQCVDLPPDVTEGERTRLSAGDLLFSITAYLGSVAVVEEDWVGGYVSQHVALCRLTLNRAEPRFVGWAMLSTDGQDQLRQGAAGGTKQQLALDDIRELRIGFPPLDEQRRIAAYLDEQTSKIDTLIAQTEKFVELARERRSAVITAAVTGQIDVRGEVA